MSKETKSAELLLKLYELLTEFTVYEFVFCVPDTVKPGTVAKLLRDETIRFGYA